MALGIRDNHEMGRTWTAGNYPKNRRLGRFRIVWMALGIRDNHEMGRVKARTVICRHDSGNNKATSTSEVRESEEHQGLA